MLKEMMSPGFSGNQCFIEARMKRGQVLVPVVPPQSGRTIIEWFCILLQTIERKTRVRRN